MEIVEGYDDDDIVDLRERKGNKKPKDTDGAPVPEIGETPDEESPAISDFPNIEDFPDGTGTDTGITPAIPSRRRDKDSGILPTITPGIIDKIIPPGQKED